MVFGILGAILVLLAAAGFIGWRVLGRHFVNQYHREACNPTDLSPHLGSSSPAEYHVSDVPWIATREWYCAANSLAMVAAQHGVRASTARCSFLMGFTYGASAVPGSIAVHFFGEPEAGLAAAAPYMGLKRRCYVTDDAALYLAALRSHLSGGDAVRVGLDVAVLYNLEAPSPHSEVLVGYDELGFFYYETVCLPEAPCQPSQLPPGQKGLWLSSQTVLDAVLGQAKMFSYPWRYSLTVFDEGPQETDLAPVWARNGNQLVGGARYGPPQGADAIEGLATVFDRRGTKVDVAEVLPTLEAAAYTRRNNAAYLREAFPGRGDIERAAQLFTGAADHYEAALESVDDGIGDEAEAEEVAAALQEAAAAEREVGELFLSLGRL